MRIERFDMERTQCLYENEVRFNLSESGVQPLSAAELLEGVDASESLLAQPLKYPEANGSRLLRERIALAYDGADADNVLVTTGTSEANYTTLWGLLEKGDRVAVMIPCYLQTRGLARAYGGRADAYRLVERTEGSGRRWALDVESLRRAVGPKTRAILVTNPNNPTGSVLSDDEMEEIVRAARRVGAWIVSDEVYRGAGVDGEPESPSFWGRYSRVIVTSGLSKAFGLPGLRVGWIAGPPKTVARLWGYQDYTTLTPSMLSDRLARAALEPARRARILERTRGILRRQLPVVLDWVGRRGDVLDLVPPRAGAIALIRYRLPVSSVAMFDRLRVEESLLITPGAHFGIGRYFRVGYGYDPGALKRGLGRLGAWIEREKTGRRGRARSGSRRGA